MPGARAPRRTRGDLAQPAAIGLDLRNQRGEFRRWQKVAADDEPVAREMLPVRGGDQVVQPAAARGGDPVRQGDPGGMQTVLVEPAAADDAVALERFRARRKLRGPQRNHRGAADLRQHAGCPLLSSRRVGRSLP